ncbi:MAG: hypothetical protein PVI30_06895 [Myxococcales bacterium]
MDEFRSVQVSPRHHVMVGEEYIPMLDRAPREDFVVRTLAKRMLADRPMMMGELVIAGEATRARYELAARYPLHFRKTYYPGRLHGDPCLELERLALASDLVGLPPPIGCTRNTFRSCFLPGVALDRLSPLGTEPPESNVALAQALSLPEAAGLWRLLEEAHDVLSRLQQGGMTHGDAHPHNFIVCSSPLEVLPIDFERAMLRDDVIEDEWHERCQLDRDLLLQMAVYLQCGLGQQRGALAREALARLDALVQSAETFRRAITERTHGEFG